MREFDPEADFEQRCRDRAMQLSHVLGCLPGEVYTFIAPEEPTMNLTYIAQAMRTNSTSTGLHAVHPDLLHATLGMCDEHFEYTSARSWLNAVEELGDLCWFIALAAHALDCDPFADSDGFLRFNPEAPLLFDAVAEFVGAVKKNYAYGKPLDLPRMRWLLSAMVSRIAAICEARAERSLDDVLAANIEKLRARFPEKFDEALAIDRNVKQEAAAMRSELH